MSQALLSSGPGEYESEAQENPFAVWLRNVPTWLDEERFYNEIGSWHDVDKEKSYCFKNKQDSSWVGIRYGWAIVTFKSKKSRNKFLDNDERHFVKENDKAPFEKLKVSPWYDKPSKKQTQKQEKPTNKIPLYKSDLEKEAQEATYEEFSRNTTDTSIQSFRGRIKTYLSPSVGDIEVKLVSQKSSLQSELVIFHADSVWSESGAKCGKERVVPGTEVSFTARKIPHGFVEGRRFQAKAVWLGTEAYPKFISPPPASRLDEYIENYVRETGQEFKSKSSTPEAEASKLRHELSNDSSGTSSPSPGLTVPGRQKPLKGGLNQLNSSTDKTRPAPALKKPVPTNFAQAVAAVPSVIKEEHSNLVLAVGTVEAIVSEVEAVVAIPDHGSFTLHLKQLDLGYKPTFAISKYVTAKQSSVSVTLKQGKTLPGSKPKYEIVRAHLNEDKKAFEDKFDPFLNDFKNKNKVPQPAAAPDTWEDVAEDGRSKNGNHDTHGDLEIDLDELDEYYDDLQRIIDYLEKELPKVIPTIVNDKNCIQKLANKILSNPKNDEAAELQTFLDHQQISSRIKHIFIAEYIKFRSKDDNEESSSTPTTPTEENPEIEANLKLFFAWLKNKEKKQEALNVKLDLYNYIIKRFPCLGNEWLKALKEPRDSHFRSFIKKSTIGETEFVRFQEETTAHLNRQMKYSQDVATLMTWLETDTNSYRSIYSETATPSASSYETGTLGLTLTRFEREYYDHQFASERERSVIPVLRAVQFLRYSEIKFEGLHKLHLRCPDEYPNQRYREFQMKIQNLLYKWANQRVLDDTNHFLAKETKGASDQGTAGRKLERYVPILAHSLSEFFEFKYGKKAKEREEKAKEKEKEKSKRVDIVDSPDKNENGVDGFAKRKRTHDGRAVAASTTFNEPDYVGFCHFLELAVASGRASLAPTASVESVIWTFRAANVPFAKLEEAWAAAQQLGGSQLSWQLQISQLQLNPPLGVTVPEVAEYLAAYFGSVNNSAATALPGDTEDQEAAETEEEEMQVVAEEDLLTMIQKNLYEQYREQEVTRFVKELRKGSIKTREAELLSSYDEIYSSQQLFQRSCWPHNEDMFATSAQCSLISAGIWHDLNVTSDFLAMCVKNAADNDLSYQGVLIKWAKMLETSSVFSSSVLDIFTIIKATLLCYADSVPAEDFANISTNYCLYNVEGYVSEHLSESMYAVQTQFSVVICHLGVTYVQRADDLSYPLPADHWKQCTLDTCLPVGTKVNLHSTGIKDQKHKIICQIADIVWGEGPGGARSDPPETGVLLPGSVTYKKYVQLFAERLVAKTTPALYSDTNYTSNNARFMELDSLYMQEIFLMEDTWPHKSILEMRKEFVFCEMGGMPRPLLRSNWAAALITSDQEKERLLNETFNFFQSDEETAEMIEFIKPYVERAGLRNAMKIMNQKYLDVVDEEEAPVSSSLNDTDSEKRKNLNNDNVETEVSGSKESAAMRPGPRNRQLSTDMIKDETLWMAENNLEQLWAEETAQEQSKRMEDLAEVNGDSEEYIEEEGDEGGKEGKQQLGAIGSSKPRTPGRETASPPSTEEIGDTAVSQVAMSGQEQLSPEERVDKLEAAVMNLAAWQPVASDIISGNRDLIVQLGARIEFLETALNQLTLNLATGNTAAGAGPGAVREAEAGKEVAKEAAGAKKGGRTYVKIVKDGEEEDIAEVPTNSDGLLPQLTVTALFGGTSAIKYRVSGSGVWRALLLEEELYHPPEDGWGERTYTCTRPQLQNTATAATKTSSAAANNNGTAAMKSTSSEGVAVNGGAGAAAAAMSPPSSTLLEPGLSYSLPQTSSLVSPYLAGLPPMAHIWGGHGGLNLASQVSPGPGLGQSIFSNLGPLGNNTAGAAANNFKGFPGPFSKNN